MQPTDAQKQIIQQFGPYFYNTGGNDILELVQRTGVTYFNNPVVSELQGCCVSQIFLIQRLLHEGLLLLSDTEDESDVEETDEQRESETEGDSEGEERSEPDVPSV
jgi:hypothetical protein